MRFGNTGKIIFGRSGFCWSWIRSFPSRRTSIPNLTKNHGPLIKKGMVLAIEPMVNEKGFQVQILDDGWTVVTRDQGLSAHYEHTVLITEDGPEILTMDRRGDE